MDFWLIAYIVTSIVIGVSLYGFLYNRGQNTGAMIVFVLLIAVFAFFGLRWFQKGALKGSVADPSGNWPPVVNLCPDFMVTWKDTNGDIFCHDVNNIYNLKTRGSEAAPLTKVTVSTNPIGGVTSGAGFKIYDNTASQTVTKITEDNGTPKRWPFITNIYKNDSNSIAKTVDSNMKLVRWEGVWDGQTATALRAPLYTP